MFTPKFGKKNAELKASRIMSSRNVMLESAILWMTSADGVNGLCLNGARKMCRTLQIRRIRVQVIIKLGSFLLFKEF